ncbi:hypothetical protein U2441_15785, partial [Listeria monocytogenes]|uniref:hypothetical protein n=1 Tax=Listeria monocytogenes TaxID=1639 RepID=UPI002FDC037A
DNYAHDLGVMTGAADRYGDGLYIAAAAVGVSFVNNVVRAWGRWGIAVTNPVQGLLVDGNKFLQYSADVTNGLGFI